MSLYPRSTLDPGQIIKDAYDEARQEIRVKTNLAVSIDGNQEILITDSIDSIKIGDGNGHYASINTDGSFNVNIVNGTTTPLQLVNTYTEVNSIAAGALTVITTYIVPSGKTGLLQKVSVSGENIATYTVDINNVTLDKRRTYFSGGLNEFFDFSSSDINGTPLAALDEITITVIHNRPSLASFDARIQVVEVG